LQAALLRLWSGHLISMSDARQELLFSIRVVDASLV
jgi:hypothetical protein